MQENNRKFIEEDEIDLRELFKTLAKRKKFIMIFTALITLGAVVYALMKNPVPVYSGSVMLEIGEVKDSGTNPVYFDNSNNLKEIIEKKYNVSADLPSRTNNLIIISSSNKDKKQIDTNIRNSVEYIFARHKEKAKLFDKYIMTEQIGDIVIDDKPINTPKKKLIVTVAFVSGLILSIFLVFLLEFIRNEDESNKNI